MTDQLSGCEANKVLDAPIRTIVGCLAEVLPKGPAQTALYWVAGLCILAAPFIYKYYLGVLAQGAALEGSIERQDYDKLRAGLAGGNLAARLYAQWLTAFLDGVERFFGDAGMADRTLFPRAFGLRTPAPLWTAPAFDRCLLLALVYPIVTIFVIWAVSCHVGPAEAALGLKPEFPGWARALSAGPIGLYCFVLWRGARTKSSVLIAASFAIAGAGAVAVATLGTGTGSFAIALAVYYAVPFAIAIAFAGDTFVRAHAVGRAGPDTIIVFGLFPVIILGLLGASPPHFFDFDSNSFIIFIFFIVLAVAAMFAAGHKWHGVFLWLFLSVAISACFGLAVVLSSLKTWEFSGPLLLFLGLLTLLNAPFDWASLGLTRALLRRGLELGGWWPYLLALVDAALAVVIIAALAFVMVLGVQAFDELAVHGGGKRVLPLDALFDGIAKNPAAPEYWWVYALLLSSMIPSLVNLAIGGMAFTRGVPGLGRLLLRWIPEGREVPDYRRPLAALVLTGQMFAGAGLGIAAQAFLAWGLIFHLMPWIGLNLLDRARAVAAFDLPARMGQLFVSFL